MQFNAFSVHDDINKVFEKAFRQRLFWWPGLQAVECMRHAMQWICMYFWFILFCYVKYVMNFYWYYCKLRFHFTEVSFLHSCSLFIFATQCFPAKAILKISCHWAQKLLQQPDAGIVSHMTIVTCSSGMMDGSLMRLLNRLPFQGGQYFFTRVYIQSGGIG